jgi:cyclic-di-AMP phosphodiesterase PgpH
MTAYFYRSFLKAFPEEAIDENKFHYPGPIPYSKETAVLMMADSVEAASRSLKKYDVETIDALVDKIINSQISQNQFVNADITFKDINILKKIFKKKLMNIYHVRVEYPR